MRALVQRVTRAKVRVQGDSVGQIDGGLCVFVGVLHDDQEQDALRLARKVAGLRIFSDAEDKMNLSVLQVGGSVLAVSQFTLCADTSRGTRPSFTSAMAPGPAKPLFEAFVEALRGEGLCVQTGVFQADMAVELENDGPVTILLETKRGT
jgi:D-tyrosyl-tRNA(Tyr) deacylase